MQKNSELRREKGIRRRGRDRYSDLLAFNNNANLSGWDWDDVDLIDSDVFEDAMSFEQYYKYINEVRPGCGEIVDLGPRQRQFPKVDYSHDDMNYDLRKTSKPRWLTEEAERKKTWVDILKLLHPYYCFRRCCPPPRYAALFRLVSNRAFLFSFKFCTTKMY